MTMTMMNIFKILACVPKNHIVLARAIRESISSKEKTEDVCKIIYIQV